MTQLVDSLFGKLGARSIWALVLVTVGFVGSAVAAIISNGPLIVGFLALSLFAETTLIGAGAKAAAFLRKASVGYATRMVLRFALALLWLVQGTEGMEFVAALALVGAAIGVRSLDVLAAAALRRRRTVSFGFANFEIKQEELAVPHLLNGRELNRALPTEVLVLAGIIGAYWASQYLWISVAGLAYGLVLIGLMWNYVRKLEGTTKLSPIDPNFQNAIEELAPRVVLYFSGGASSVYQVNMWLSTIERLEVPALIVLRERAVFDALGATSTPIICVPNATDLMNMDFSSVRVALYAANVGKNIHFLRIPHIKSVFIGHGDSDKNASFNPYSRVYDEVWVAGPAGRKRYQRALIGVTDEAIKEVGRPQVVSLVKNAVVGSEKPVKTLLYAPTWEGWNEDQNYCSIESVGLPLIRRIISEKLPIRILYRPHPFSGNRLKSVLEASREISRLLAEANELARVETAALPSVVETDSAIDAEVALAERDRLYLDGTMAGAHVTLLPKQGTAMTSCMIAADTMLTDVSSVLSDYLATGKPYATANPSSMSQTEFVEAFPATAGGFVLAPGSHEVEEFLSVLLAERTDPHAGARGAMRDELLGQAPERSLEDFKSALESLAHQADQRLEQLEEAK